MSSLFPQHWFLELEGKRMGPFSPEQVLGLLADGEIPEGLVVFPLGVNGEEDRAAGMTAASMREAYFHDDRLPMAEPVGGMQTAILVSTSAGSPDAGPESDPSAIPVAREEIDSEAVANLATARRLFDLFQSARERRTKFAPPSTDELARIEGERSKALAWVRSPIAAAAAASLALALGVRYLGNRPGLVEEAQRQIAQSKQDTAEAKQSTTNPVAAAAPIRPAAPPRPVAKIQNTWKPSVRPAAPPVHEEPQAPARQYAPAARAFNKPIRGAQPPRAQQQSDENWGDRRDPPTAYEQNRPPEEAPQADPNQVNNVAMDQGLAPGQMPPEQPFNDPNSNPNGNPNENPDGQQPPAEQPQDSYRVE